MELQVDYTNTVREVFVDATIELVEALIRTKDYSMLEKVESPPSKR
jgi:uncharacterized membrane protein